MAVSRGPVDHRAGGADALVGCKPDQAGRDRSALLMERTLRSLARASRLATDRGLASNQCVCQRRLYAVGIQHEPGSGLGDWAHER